MEVSAIIKKTLTEVNIWQDITFSSYNHPGFRIERQDIKKVDGINIILKVFCASSGMLVATTDLLSRWQKDIDWLRMSILNNITMLVEVHMEKCAHHHDS
jgi:hypothetical protein